jgi:NAD-dependent deacetylase
MAGTEQREYARKLVENARAIAVLTGAGVSAESGVPTFRGSGGLWRGRSALELATPEAFRRDPEEVWEFYHARLMGLRSVLPNDGHRALAALEATRERFWLLTQNVDGLHRQAGSVNVIELHGTIRTARCSRCARSLDMSNALAGWRPGAVPACPVCSAPLRPNVVWFGESLPESALRQADDAIAHCDLMLVAGTSGVVQPAASFAFQARGHGARVIEVNPEETPISAIADVELRGHSARELPQLLSEEERAWLSPHTADD